MTTLLLGFDGPRFLLLTLAGQRPLLLECPPELRPVVEVAEPDGHHQASSTMPPPPPLTKVRSRIDPNHVWQDEPPPPSPRARSPEVHIDPRTVFKRRKVSKEAFGPRSHGSVSIIEAAAGASHDFIIVPGNAGFRPSEQGVKALLSYLRTAQMMVPSAQREDPSGTYIELQPDAFAHLVFTEGAAPVGAPALLEGTLWFGKTPAALPFADPTRASHFRLEIKGARFPRICKALLARLHQILYLHPEAIATSHDPARLRGSEPRIATGPIPRCDVQETDTGSSLLR